MANGHEPPSAGGDNPHNAEGPSFGDNQLLEWAGRSLYGPVHWRVELTALLQVKNRRTLQRWLNGQNEIPPGVWTLLRGQLAARIWQQQHVLDTIKTRHPPTTTKEEASNVATNEHD